MNLAGGDDSFVAGPDRGDGSWTSTGADGNDTIDGGDAADLIAAGAGNDRIIPDDNPAGTRDDRARRRGDDTIVWNPGDDDDINEGGDGNDVSEVNGGTGPEDFTIKPGADAPAASVRPHRPDPARPVQRRHRHDGAAAPHANDGNDRIKGAKGIAGRILTELNGDGGNDPIKGTDAEDRRQAGKGSDIIKSRDKAEDTVSCDSGHRPGDRRPARLRAPVRDRDRRPPARGDAGRRQVAATRPRCGSAASPPRSARHREGQRRARDDRQGAATLKRGKRSTSRSC